MSLLLDSHVVLWWFAGGALLSRRAATSIAAATRLYVSPISCWEIALLSARGRVRLDRDVHAWIQALMTMDVITEAPLSPAAAVTAALIDPAAFPGDPADRLLFATAKELGVPLVTKDRALRDFAAASREVRAIW